MEACLTEHRAEVGLVGWEDMIPPLTEEDFSRSCGQRW